MEKHRAPFRIDRENGKVLGVCAGIAEHFDVDVTLVRVGMAVSAFVTFPMVVLGYFLVAMVVEQKGKTKSGANPVAKSARAEEARETMRDLDRRLQALERDVTSSGTRLAREIDSLR